MYSFCAPNASIDALYPFVNVATAAIILITGSLISSFLSSLYTAALSFSRNRQWSDVFLLHATEYLNDFTMLSARVIINVLSSFDGFGFWEDVNRQDFTSI